MPRMTGGDAIVDFLLRHGVDTIFEPPGVHMYGLFEIMSDIAKDYPPYTFHQPRLK